MERLVTDEMLQDLLRGRGGLSADLPLDVIRRRLRYHDYDYDLLATDVHFAIIDRYDEIVQGGLTVANDILRKQYRVSWPDGSRWDGVTDVPIYNQDGIAPL